MGSARPPLLVVRCRVVNLSLGVTVRVQGGPKGQETRWQSKNRSLLKTKQLKRPLQAAVAGGWKLETECQRGLRHGLVTESSGSVVVNQAFLEWSGDCWFEPRCALLCSLLLRKSRSVSPAPEPLPALQERQEKRKQPKHNHSYNL